jgi:hypothetical protein
MQCSYHSMNVMTFACMRNTSSVDLKVAVSSITGLVWLYFLIIQQGGGMSECYLSLFLLVVGKGKDDFQ